MLEACRTSFAMHSFFVIFYLLIKIMQLCDKTKQVYLDRVMQKETKRQSRFLKRASLTIFLQANRSMDSHETFSDFSLDYKEKSVKILCKSIKRLVFNKIVKLVLLKNRKWRLVSFCITASKF